MTREEMRYKLNELRMMLNDGEHGEEQGVLVEIISELDKGEWIPISERVPEDGSWAIFTDGSTISVERYKADAEDHFFPDGRWFSLEDATAWMPLPEPYKAESEEVNDGIRID